MAVTKMSYEGNNKVEAVKKTITGMPKTTNMIFEEIIKTVKKQVESIRKLTEAEHQYINNEKLSLKIAE